MSKYMDFQVVISAPKRNEAQKGTRGVRQGEMGLQSEREVREPCWVTVKQGPA